MAETIKIKRGVNIPLVGEPQREITEVSSDSCAIKPADFHGLIPKMMLKEGAEVKVGTPLFHDKYHDQIVYTAPVSGEVTQVLRGDKRLILEIRVLADKEQKYETFSTDSDSVDQIKKTLLSSGMWPFFKQRPYDVVANPTDTPKAIFISAFDSAPLAPDYTYILKDRGADLQKGIDVVSKLTSGKVYLNINGREDAGVFGILKGVVLNKFEGPHPAGNPGVQIHHLNPINKGERVWVINPQDLAAIGYLFNQGKLDNHRTIALTGSECKNPGYLKVRLGSQIKPMVSGRLAAGGIRIISGNVLTGYKTNEDGYLGAYHHQITAIPESHEPEFFGWIAPGFDKFSLSRSFFSWLMPAKKYRLNTLQHGEERAFVMSGQYEKVFPFDIYPVHLLKAMLTENVDEMEKLGVYEVAPEDFALCEFGCTSKIEVQKIVRNALDLIQKECG
jgi:Na+-transporting NADH:ubiquinone oxidoreductase subunit A